MHTPDNNQEILRVIDNNGKWNGKYLSRKEASTIPGILFNTAFVWLYNKQTNSVLFEIRSLNKKYNPGKYGLVGGHVEKDDSIDETIYKEVFEEIGIDIKDKKITLLGIAQPCGVYRSFAYNYICFCDMDIEKVKIQKNELEGVKYIPYQQVKEEVLNNSDKYSITKERYSDIFKEIDKVLSKNQ
ncbi:MAG: NUDIX domain-containing protein [Mycoplasmataceae bacterium]|nr:NUDIX domain-containing protein [Mycoplasmataceae bacterium]